MDTITIIIVISVIVVITSLVIYSNWTTKKKWQQAYTSFEKFAEKHGGVISRYATWDKSAIGIDKKSHKAFFKKRFENEQELVIDLMQVKQCYVNILRSTNQTVRMLELVFIPKDNKLKNTSVEFYNVDEKLILGPELQLIEEWHKIITSHLTDLVQ